MQDLKNDYTLVIVTHNMQQAARVAERTAFFSLDVSGGQRKGILVEYDDTATIFTRPPTSGPRITSPAASASDPVGAERGPRRPARVASAQLTGPLC